jgi:hypothetical protein
MQIVHRNGSMLAVDGCDEARKTRILGSEWGLIHFEEAIEAAWSTVKLLITRLSQQVPSLPSRKLVLSLNPGSPLSWQYQVGVLKQDPDKGTTLPDADSWFRLNFLLRHNTANLPSDLIRSLNDLTGVEKRRLCDGEWVASDRMCYPAWNPDTATIHEPDISKMATRWIVGGDAGWNDPMCLVLFAVLKNPDGRTRMHAVEEFSCPGKDMSVSLSKFCERWRHLGATYVIDPSASPAILDLSASGFDAKPGHNKLADGIAVLKDLIDTGRFTCEPQCREALNRDLSTYEMDIQTEKPVKGQPIHHGDCCRYACYEVCGDEQPGPIYVF